MKSNIKTWHDFLDKIERPTKSQIRKAGKILREANNKQEETNLKELIDQAGFKSQAEFARSVSICPESICAWKNKPEQCPRVYVQYLNVIIEGNELKKKIEALERLLSGYLHPEG